MKRLSRRALFRISAERLALLALASRTTACTRYEGSGEVKVLSAKQVTVLVALAEVFVPPTDRIAVALEETDFVLRVDRFLERGDSLATRQFLQLLSAFEHYPQLLTFHFTRFTRLPLADRDAIIRDFSESRFFLKRSIFTALKSVICNHYFSGEKVQAALGYAPACRW
jgi:hypothetical protein